MSIAGRGRLGLRWKLKGGVTGNTYLPPCNHDSSGPEFYNLR
jgi:hypothetical protein